MHQSEQKANLYFAGAAPVSMDITLVVPVEQTINMFMLFGCVSKPKPVHIKNKSPYLSTGENKSPKTALKIT